MGQDWIFFAVSTYLPKYMKDVLGFPVYEIGLYTTLPTILTLVVSTFSAFLCDHLIVKNYVTITHARKIFIFAGMKAKNSIHFKMHLSPFFIGYFSNLAGVPPAIFIVFASYAGCDKAHVIFWFILALGFMGNYYCSLKIHSLDLSPNYAGSISAIVNGAGSITGIVAPVFVGMMIPNVST